VFSGRFGDGALSGSLEKTRKRFICRQRTWEHVCIFAALHNDGQMAASDVLSTLCREFLAKRTESSRISLVCSSVCAANWPATSLLPANQGGGCFVNHRSNVVIRTRLPRRVSFVIWLPLRHLFAVPAS
jgi:hypothetical protein